MSSEYDYTIWQGDSDEIEITLSDADGVINLSAADEILAIMEEYSGSPRYEIACSGTSGGVVTIPLTSTETASHGRFKLRVQVTIGDIVNTWPSEGPIYIRILESF
jgi:hypothetical protein